MKKIIIIVTTFLLFSSCYKDINETEIVDVTKDSYVTISSKGIVFTRSVTRLAEGFGIHKKNPVKDAVVTVYAGDKEIAKSISKSDGSYDISYDRPVNDTTQLYFTVHKNGFLRTVNPLKKNSVSNTNLELSTIRSFSNSYVAPPSLQSDNVIISFRTNGSEPVRVIAEQTVDKWERVFVGVTNDDGVTTLLLHKDVPFTIRAIDRLNESVEIDPTVLAQSYATSQDLGKIELVLSEPLFIPQIDYQSSRLQSDHLIINDQSKLFKRDFPYLLMSPRGGTYKFRMYDYKKKLISESIRKRFEPEKSLTLKFDTGSSLDFKFEIELDDEKYNVDSSDHMIVRDFRIFDRSRHQVEVEFGDLIFRSFGFKKQEGCTMISDLYNKNGERIEHLYSTDCVEQSQAMEYFIVKNRELKSDFKEIKCKFSIPFVEP